MSWWITTHWPVGRGGPDLLRQVYVKTSQRRVPTEGDGVLVYESETVTVDGRRVTETIRCHHGVRERVEVPRGRGAAGQLCSR